VHNIGYLRFYHYLWVDTDAGELLVPEGMIRPVVNASALTWLDTYMFDWLIWDQVNQMS
jgi:hypothetical protein